MDPVEVRSWDTNMGDRVERLHYYKLRLMKRTPMDPDVFDELIGLIKNDKPKAKLPKGDETFVLALADWQLGKSDGGGTKEIIKKVNQMISDTKKQIKDLRKVGHNIDELYIVGLGDLVEGCDGHYDMQTFNVDLDMRSQVRLAWQLLIKIVKNLAPMFNQVTITCVPGNHGEVRRNGKAFTTFGDNWDVHVFEVLEAVISENKNAYGHVKFDIPDDELIMVTNIRGKKCVFAHGHQFRSGGTGAFEKQKKWLAMQSLAKLKADGCDILLSGHYHHLSIVQEFNTLFLQAPSIDGGSRWVENTHALVSDPGTLTFVIGNNTISNMEVI